MGLTLLLARFRPFQR